MSSTRREQGGVVRNKTKETHNSVSKRVSELTNVKDLRLAPTLQTVEGVRAPEQRSQQVFPTRLPWCLSEIRSQPSLPKAPSLQPSPDFSAFTACLSPCSLPLQPSREVESRAWLSRCCQSRSCSHALATASAGVIVTLGSLTCYLHGPSLAGGLFHVHSLLTMSGSEGGEQIR